MRPPISLSGWIRGFFRFRPKKGPAPSYHISDSLKIRICNPRLILQAYAGAHWQSQKGSMTGPPKWNAAACEEAASLGLMHELEEQTNLRVVSRWSHKIWCAAAAAGQVDVFHWALQQGTSLSMDPRQCLSIAAENGQDRCCRWIFNRFPARFRSYQTMNRAAEDGRWPVVKMLCTLQLKPDPSASDPAWHLGQLHHVSNVAAAQGNLDFIQWAWTFHSSNHMTDIGIAQAAANGNFHILEWLLEMQLPAHRHLLWKFFAVAIAYQSHSTLDLMASLGLRVAGPDLPQPEPISHQQLLRRADLSLQQLAMRLTPAKRGDPLWQAAFREALQASPWAKAPPEDRLGPQGPTLPAEAETSQRYAGLLCWLVNLVKPNKHIKFRMQLLMDDCRSIVPIQLAAQGLTPRLPWTPFTHRLAGAHADLPTLAWMLKRRRNSDVNVIVDDCPPARMLLLVKRHGWTIPQPLRSAFLAAEVLEQQSCCLAFVSIVHQQRKRPPGQACLGSLPNELIHPIAQLAGYDLHDVPAPYGHAVGGLQACKLHISCDCSQSLCTD